MRVNPQCHHLTIIWETHSVPVGYPITRVQIVLHAIWLINSLLSVIFNPVASTTVEDLQSPVLRRTMCSFLSLVSKTAAAKELQGTQAETPAKTLPTHLLLAPSTFSWPPLLLCSPGTLQVCRTQVPQPFCWIISLFYTKQWQLPCLGSIISRTQTYHRYLLPIQGCGIAIPQKTRGRCWFAQL